MCSNHNREITFYNRARQQPICEQCYHDALFEQQTVLAGTHYPISNPDIVRIDKFISDAIQQMQHQVASFSVFYQSKKTSGPLQNSTGQKSDYAMVQYINDDRTFEEAHNSMINRLTQFQNLSPNDKILYVTQTINEFEKTYQIATNVMKKIQDYMDRVSHPLPGGYHHD